MNRIKILFIVFFIVFSLISIYFVTNLGSFEEKAQDCFNNGGQCMSEACENVGMQDHVDGVCPVLKKGSERTIQYCCMKKWV